MVITYRYRFCLGGVGGLTCHLQLNKTWLGLANNPQIHDTGSSFWCFGGGGGVGHNVIFNFSRFFMGILQAKCLNYEMYDPWVSG